MISVTPSLCDLLRRRVFTDIFDFGPINSMWHPECKGATSILKLYGMFKYKTNTERETNGTMELNVSAERIGG